MNKLSLTKNTWILLYCYVISLSSAHWPDRQLSSALSNLVTHTRAAGLSKHGTSLYGTPSNNILGRYTTQNSQLSR